MANETVRIIRPVGTVPRGTVYEVERGGKPDTLINVMREVNIRDVYINDVIAILTEAAKDLISPVLTVTEDDSVDGYLELTDEDRLHMMKMQVEQEDRSKQVARDALKRLRREHPDVFKEVASDDG